MAGLSSFNVINFFVTEFTEFSDKHLGKTPIKDLLHLGKTPSCIRVCV